MPAFAEQPAPAFSQIVVFGDSLSDTGNVRDRTNGRSGGLVDYPSGTFNFSDGRFTNSSDTDPGSATYVGVWHEQLANTFLGIPAATYSLGGGSNFAFGGATTKNGTHEEVAISPPFFGDVTITIDDMGKQMDDYLAAHPIDPNALYVVWGGGNDLFDDDSGANVSATADRASALMSRLAIAGAQYIMVPNVPPLGDIPQYSNNSAKIVSLNAASASYRGQLNTALTTSLNALAAQGIMPTVYRVDAWTNTVRVMTYPDRYGFTDVRNSSQGNSGVNPDDFLFWDDKHPTTAGHYWTAKGANDTLTIPFTPPAKALNIATRVFVATGERVPIAGFIIAGDLPKRVLIRGIGPSLAASGVPNPLADPTLTLFDSAGKGLRSNDNWRDSQQAEIMATGIPPQNDLESAIVVNLSPGPYTAVMTGQGGTTGNGLVEVYDLEPDIDSTLSNLSTRGFVGAGDDVMIAGLIIGNGDLPIVVVRAIGPTLASSGIVEPLLNPTIALHDGNGAIIGFNDDWKDGQIQPLFATQLNPTNDRESAIVGFLAPGNYTAVVRGANDTTGVALVEAYRVP
ncbi:MAG TPA: SGNH/GDSL hydrolase family protein [Phycisphaerae bacterium]|nr:SGNH/GDSL hydrolase family protein [Phycisphaerae bacterium]